MKRYSIFHQTTYTFAEKVNLNSHKLRLRPREGHELRIESSKLEIFPEAVLRWHRDVEGNSVLTANFTENSNILKINSEVVIQQYDLSPLDFLISHYAVDYPFNYSNDDYVLLSAYLKSEKQQDIRMLEDFISGIWQASETVSTLSLLLDINQRIYQSMFYLRREEEGVQDSSLTLSKMSGSCRDFANLFIEIARHLGFAARFVTGYIYSNSSEGFSGATHAWAEVYIPGAGWKGFDPTIGDVVASQHIAVAVARLPESVPPVEGTYFGQPYSTLSVNVSVTDLTI